jgi:hypothetical protein
MKSAQSLEKLPTIHASLFVQTITSYTYLEKAFANSWIVGLLQTGPKLLQSKSSAGTLYSRYFNTFSLSPKSQKQKNHLHLPLEISQPPWAIFHGVFDDKSLVFASFLAFVASE